MDSIKENVKWFVSLSNGETFFEGKGKFTVVNGEPSPWNKLLQYLKDKELRITSIGLYTDDGRTFNLPSAGRNPKHFVFQEKDKPIGYNMFRAFGTDKTPNAIADIYTVIEAKYDNYKLQLWVSENDTSNCWVVVV